MNFTRLHFSVFLASISASIVSSQNACLATINALALEEAAIDDVSVMRKYTLCPNTVYAIGRLNNDNDVVEGQAFLPLRPNLHVQCGPNGSHEDQCLMQGGSLQVDGSSAYGISDSRVDNVILEGITFVNATRNVWINKPGNVTFKDCEFLNNVAFTTPVHLDYFDGSASSEALTVTFANSRFENNQYPGRPATPALILSSSRQNRLILEDCAFSGNDMTHNNTLSETQSALIESSGPLRIVRNCFSFNQMGVSPVVLYNGDFQFLNNFDELSRGIKCPLTSRFESAAQFEAFAPICEDFDAATCLLSETGAATPAPNVTTVPTPAVGGAPTVSPAGAVPSTPTGTVPAPTLSPAVVDETDRGIEVPESSAVYTAHSVGLSLMAAFFVVVCQM
jgi:hypothetical protein